jgi:Ca2+-binding RTX toxin-like protein
MALQVFAFNSIGPGVRAQLNTTDDLIIDAGVTVSRTDGNNFTQHTVQGTGSNHSLEIDGRVLGSGGVIDVGDQLGTDQNNDIDIGANAIVRSSDNYAIRMRSFDSFLKNEGTLEGDSFGVIIGGSNNGTQSLIRNSGSILGKNDDGISRFGGSTEQLKIINTGTIKGDEFAFDANGTNAVDKIINKGTMTGDLKLDGGDDFVNSRQGKIAGTAFGGEGNDKMFGGNFNDIFEGGNGNDILRGGGGSDKLTGDIGKDVLFGGGGKDFFDFNSVNDSKAAFAQRDLIKGFKQGEDDKIDLAGIDAQASTAGDQAFDFIGKNAFSGNEGELRYVKSGGQTLVQADTDGDFQADFTVALNKVLNFDSSDFLL